MTLSIAALWALLLLAALWLLRGRLMLVSGTARGACAGIVVGFPAAALYAQRDPASDLAADLIAVTIPVCFGAFYASVALQRESVGEASRRGALPMLVAGVLLMLVCGASRLSLLDAQIILALGAVVLWIADHGPREPVGRPHPLGLIGLSLLAGVCGIAVVADSTAPPLWALACGVSALTVFFKLLGREARVEASGAAIVAALIFGFGGGVLGAGVLAAVENFSIIHPVGFMDRLEVVALSVGTAPRLIGLGRLAPEAALLAGSGLFQLLTSGRPRWARVASLSLLGGGSALGAYRLLVLFGPERGVF